MIRRRQSACLLAAALAMALLLCGCPALWYGLESLFPQEKVSAKFTLPKGKTVLVFPDDLQNPVSYPPVKRALGNKLGELLTEKKLVSEVVPYAELARLKAREVEFNLMSIPKVGGKLQADLVVYVNIETFTLKDNPVDTLWRGRLSARVKVVDVLKGRIWPDESAGHPVKVAAPAAESNSDAFGGELAKMLGESLAVEIAQLFHDHYVDRARPKRTDFAAEE